jgi:hypothetical protein
MVGYEKNDFFFLQTTSTKNHSVTHFSVSTFIELPKTKTEKRKMTDERKEGGWRKRKRSPKGAIKQEEKTQ